MTAQNDILLDDDGDLMITDGDFVIGDSLNQRVGLLLQLNKGELKQYPLTGVGIIDMINSESMDTIANEVRTQLKADGLKLRKIEMVNNKIHIHAEYE